MSKQTIEADKKSVLEAYRKADKKEKKSLENIFGKGTFEEPSSDWMELWDSFCKKNKLKVVLPYSKPSDSVEESANAYIMLTHIVRIKNKGWTPDWDNGNEYKYYPYFNMRSGSSFGFAHATYEYWAAGANVGSRLCFSSSALAESTAKEFLAVYEKFVK